MQQLGWEQGNPQLLVQEEQGNQRLLQLLGSWKLLEVNEMTHFPELGHKAWSRGTFSNSISLASCVQEFAASSSRAD